MTKIQFEKIQTSPKCTVKQIFTHCKKNVKKSYKLFIARNSQGKSYEF